MTDRRDDSTTIDLDIVVPCFNEQSTLAEHIRQLHAYLTAEMPGTWRITIADNASTDDTARIADDLATTTPNVVAVHLDRKGRGLALRTVWLASPARVQVYVDEDLSTDLAALRPLVAPLLSGHSDLAIGTRLSGSARVVRGGKREFISRTYNMLLRTTMGATFSDAQCGFKAIRREAAQLLLPLVKDDAWFFDTELLVLAERAGLRIHEVPVDWVDDVNSSVHIRSTATEDLRGMIRVSRDLSKGRIPIDAVYAKIGRRPFTPPQRGFWSQVFRFVAVGIVSTVAFAVLYVLLQPGMGAQAADFFALLITAIGNTALNRRFTFGVRGSAGAGRHHVQGLVVFGIAWCITAGSLVLLHAADPSPSTLAQVGTLTVANLVATAVRFVLFKLWVFRRPSRTDDAVSFAEAGVGVGVAEDAAGSADSADQPATQPIRQPF